VAKKEPRSLYGKVVAITGGARGIGKATAQALVRQGARVGIGDLDVDEARKTAEELGGGAEAFELNVADRASFARFLDDVERDLGPVDVLINNAGIMPLGRFDEEDDATTLRQIDINVIGVMTGCKLAIPKMKQRGSGHIVNIASMAGRAGYANAVTYCTTKFAVVGLSEALRSELRETGIDLSVVCPGVVNTELGSGLNETRAVKVVEPEEVADAIVEALRHNTFDVFIPPIAGVIYRVAHVLPRSAAEAMGKALKADQVLVNPDQNVRASYEARAAASDPGVEERAAEAEPAPPAGETVSS
jgi:NAD(P)-dependent dehydrogenase (short-subunit alcohol dehydrogenase family)